MWYNTKFIAVMHQFLQMESTINRSVSGTSSNWINLAEWFPKLPWQKHTQNMLFRMALCFSWNGNTNPGFLHTDTHSNPQISITGVIVLKQTNKKAATLEPQIAHPVNGSKIPEPWGSNYLNHQPVMFYLKMSNHSKGSLPKFWIWKYNNFIFLHSTSPVSFTALQCSL